MSRINPHSLGCVFGIVLAAWHALWSFLIWIGVAQTLMDLIFLLHMVTPPYRIAAFNLGTAAILVLLTGGIGYVMGFLVAVIWNRFGPRAAQDKLVA